MTQERKDILKYALGAIIVLSLAYAAYQYGQAVEGTYSSRTFTVEGKAKVESLNNVATFTATVLTEGSLNQGEVQSKNSEQMNKVVAYLATAGVSKEDVKTDQYSLTPQYSNILCYAAPCPEPKIIGYRATQNVVVKVRAADTAGTLLAGVVQNGATSVSEVRFMADNKDAGVQEARIKALDDAKTQAERLAKAGNFRLGKLITFYEQGQEGEGPYPLAGVADAGMEKAIAPVLNPGVTEEEVKVTVTYEIK